MPDAPIALHAQPGDALSHLGVTVLPLFPRRAPRAGYLALEHALALGLVVREVSDAGSVADLVVENPLDQPVLLYEGEELTGAKQDRILDVAVLVPARAAVAVSVSCVERGRWSARTEAFWAADHMPGPSMRRGKAEALSGAGWARGSAQGAVWAEVDDRHRLLGVRSPTAAHADAFRSRHEELARMAAAFPIQPGQCGTVLGLGGRAVCMDLVSRPDAFARLWPRLLRGYLLDALEHLGGPATPQAALEALPARVAAAHRTRAPARAGLGQTVMIGSPGPVGSALELDGELIQVSAFAGREPRGGGIARPSRRRG
ncbi:MAG: hypothetical protein MUE51_02860 [Thermoleophilia bacterium]|nr:hypothetical protein [Thermoleophilia bacterium]